MKKGSGNAPLFHLGRLSDFEADGNIRRLGNHGSLTQRSSPTAFLFLILLFAVRGALRWLVELGDARRHLGAMLVSDIFIALAVGALCFYRLELWLRARRLRRPG
jgi:hypothetical protein